MLFHHRHLRGGSALTMDHQIGPFTPTHLARSPVPPRLKPSNLALEEEPANRPKFDPYVAMLFDMYLTAIFFSSALVIMLLRIPQNIPENLIHPMERRHCQYSILVSHLKLQQNVIGRTHMRLKAWHLFLLLAIGFSIYRKCA